MWFVRLMISLFPYIFFFLDHQTKHKQRTQTDIYRHTQSHKLNRGMNDEDEIVFLVSLLCSMNHMHFYSPNRESEKNIIIFFTLLLSFLSELLGG